MQEGEDYGQAERSSQRRRDDGLEATVYEAVQQPFSCELRDEEEKASMVCRICLEPEADLNTLLHPCKCTGSVRYIHESCLKAWLSSHSSEISTSHCELCHTPFRMTTHITRQFTPKEACHEGIAPCLFVPLLISILGLLIVIIYLLADRYIQNSNSDSQKGYAGALVAICTVCMLVIGFLVARSLRDACCSRKLTEWVILNYENPPDSVRDGKVARCKSASRAGRISILLYHTTPHLSSGFTIDIDISQRCRREGAATNLDIRGDDEEEKASEPPILVLPKKITINGVKVKTPSLPCISLTPVHQRGRIVAVTPRAFAYPASLSQSRLLTPVGTCPSPLLWSNSSKAFNVPHESLIPNKSEVIFARDE